MAIIFRICALTVDLLIGLWLGRVNFEVSEVRHDRKVRHPPPATPKNDPIAEPKMTQHHSQKCF